MDNEKIANRGVWFYLFFSLIFMIAIYPYFDRPDQAASPWIFAFFNSIVVLAVIYASSAKKYQFWIVLVLGLLVLVLHWMPSIIIAHRTMLWIQSFLYLYAIYLSAHHLTNTKHIGVEEIYAAISLYLLLGIGWTSLYLLIDHFQPGSFHYEQASQGLLTWSDLLYFSFITLTTTGYGDITPAAPVARSMAILESITGLFCLGIMVSGAIGRYVSLKVREDLGEVEDEL